MKSQFSNYRNVISRLWIVLITSICCVNVSFANTDIDTIPGHLNVVRVIEEDVSLTRVKIPKGRKGGSICNQQAEEGQ